MIQRGSKMRTKNVPTIEPTTLTAPRSSGYTTQPSWSLNSSEPRSMAAIIVTA